MTEVEKERNRLLKIEKKITNELTDRFNDLIAVLFFISTSDMGIRDKKKQINKAANKLKKYIRTFSQSNLKRIYKQRVREAYKALDQRPKSLTTGQEKELATFVTAMIVQLDGVTSKYQTIALNVSNKEERKKTRERSLGYTDGEERRAVRGDRLTRDFDFKDSKGRRIKSDAVTKVTAGDTTWDMMISAQNSVFLLAGLNYGYHRSVLDDRTSNICNDLDGEIRDLSRDQLPPMHPNCRSVIETIFDPEFRP